MTKFRPPNDAWQQLTDKLSTVVLIYIFILSVSYSTAYIQVYIHSRLNFSDIYINIYEKKKLKKLLYTYNSILFFFHISSLKFKQLIYIYI